MGWGSRWAYLKAKREVAALTQALEEARVKLEKEAALNSCLAESLSVSEGQRILLQRKIDLAAKKALLFPMGSMPTDPTKRCQDNSCKTTCEFSGHPEEPCWGPVESHGDRHPHAKGATCWAHLCSGHYENGDYQPPTHLARL